MSVFKIRPAVVNAPSDEKPKVRPLFSRDASEESKLKSEQPVVEAEKPKVKPIVPPQPRPATPSPSPIKVKAITPPPAPAASAPVKRVLFADKAIVNNTDGLPQNVVNHPSVKDMEAIDIRRAYNLSLDLSIEDTKELFSFGDYNREKFANIVNTMVDAAKQSALQSANDALAEVCTILGTIQFSNLLKQEKVGFFGNLFGKKEEFCLKSTIDWFNQATANADNKLATIQQTVASMSQQIDTLEELYKQNKDDFRLLQIQVAAGEMFVERITNDLNAINSTDAFVLSDVQYKKMCVDRFSQKIVELKQTAHDVLLNAPQIRLMQLNIQDLSERTKKVAMTIYPRWKSQFTGVVTAIQNSVNANKAIDLNTTLQQHTNLVSDFAATQNQLTSLVDKK